MYNISIIKNKVLMPVYFMPVGQIFKVGRGGG